MTTLPARIEIREVGPRDGLQAEAPVAIADRVALIDTLAASGLRSIEACSFVSPRAVPAMAGGAQVLDSLPRLDGVRYAALVPNVRGAELALAAGVDELTVTVSASETYSQKNVHKSVDEAVAETAAIIGLASDTPVDVVISCAFGSPYEGDMDAGVIAGVADAVLAAGAARCTYADTTGMATPRHISALLAVVPSGDIGLHLHETRGTGLVNAYAAMELGVSRFDTSIGGLGGSPFTAGAAGNLATEELVYLCAEEGVVTGVDLERLLEAVALAAQLVGHELPSAVAKAGPRSRLSAPV